MGFGVAAQFMDQGLSSQALPGLNKPMLVTDIETALEPFGLRSLGAFHPALDEPVPGAGDLAATTVVLVGGAGPDMWRVFSAETRDEREPNPLDAWSRRTLGQIAGKLGGRALFPFDGPPYLPFQAWAMRARSLHRSPIGPLIDPEFGLWLGYRGALVIPEKIEIAPIIPVPSPCLACPDRPCLTACPVGAFAKGSYDVPACIGHLETPSGQQCFEKACLARRACPVGAGHGHGPDQAMFHVKHFFAAHQK